MSNDIYNSMLQGYPMDTDQQKRNAIFEVNQQVYLLDSTMVASSTKLLSMEALV